MNNRHLREDLLKRFITYALVLFVIFVLIINGFFAFSSINLSKQTNMQVVELFQQQLENSLLPARSELQNKYKLHYRQNVECDVSDLVYLTDLEVLSFEGIVVDPICGDSKRVGFDMSNQPIFNEILATKIGQVVYGNTTIDNNTGLVRTGFGYKTTDHVILAHVTFDDFDDFITRDNVNEAVLAIVDENGTYIYNDDEIKVEQRVVDPNFLSIQQGEIKSGDIVSYKGKNHYVFISEMEEANWTVMIYQDQAFILKSVLQISALIVVMIFVLIILLIMNINEVLKKIESNLRLFSGAAVNVADGHYELIDFDKQYEEFKEVSVKMNEMIDEINEREKEIILLNDSLELSYLNTLTVLAKAIEAKDHYTGSHCERVSYYSLVIGEKMDLSESDMYQLRYGSLLHDIGKISVAEGILLKPTRLEEWEFDEIKKHPSNGHILVRDLPKFEKAKELVLYHHERYDGKGYPSGLKGDDIPLMARIVCVADAFDAMTSDRVYRPGIMMNKEAFKELRDNAGTQFDPVVVEHFIEVMEQLDNG
jgi:HD-GYP domain-containing protein (c-di-GMP phosphodiesterase class II)